METFAVWLTAVGALAITVTKVVDLLRNLLDRDDSYPKAVWNIAAFGIGVLFCVGWQIDITGELIAQVPALAEKRLSDVAGQIVTGLAAGGFAGFWHEALDALHGIAGRRT